MCDMELEVVDDAHFPVWQEPCHAVMGGRVETNPWAAGWKQCQETRDNYDDELPSPIFTTDSPGEPLETGFDGAPWDVEPTATFADAGARDCLSPCESAEDNTFEWWGSMEGVAARIDSLPAASPPSQATITVRCEGRAVQAVKVDALDAPHAVQAAIREAFELDQSAHVTLRDSGGCLVPVTTALINQGHFDLEIPELVTKASPARALLPPSFLSCDSPCLEFIQEPPKGACEWLTVNVTKAGVAKPQQHTFGIEVAVRDDTRDNVPAVEANEFEILQNATVRLFNPAMVEVSQLLHVGTKMLVVREGGRRSVRWNEVGVTSVSSSSSIGIAQSTAVDMEHLRSENAIKGGRCAQGWYHLCISAPGVAVPDLWLRADTANSGDSELARIIIKHKRCYKTGRWVEKCLGPYADHSLCRPSHIGADGQRRCRSCSSC